MKVLSLFDGISCGRLALERAGIKVEKYYASEIDKYAIAVAQKNYPDTIQVGDVNNLNYLELLDVDIVMGGSPCQDLSIAKQNREGLRGERSKLFWKYVEALEVIRPKWFLLENVASMKNEDRDAITETLRKLYPETECIMINSALVSAQQRKRYYWTNWHNTQPADKGIVLRDILENAQPIKSDKSRAVLSSAGRTTEREYFKKNQGTMVAEPLELVPFVEDKLPEIEKKFGELPQMFNPYNKSKITDKAPTQTAQSGGQTNSSTVLMFEPVKIDNYFRKYGTKGKIMSEDTEKTQCLTASAGCGGGNTPLLAEPVKPNRVGGFYDQVTRWGIYDEDGTSPTLTASMGMGGGYVPFVPERIGQKEGLGKGQANRIYSVRGKSVCLNANGGGSGAKTGLYKVDLPDGDYIIRKLTPVECERLQTLPDNWTDGISNSQRYKAIGNGWTVDVIAWLLKGIKQ